ncbi:MAG: hypothetical protein A2010_14290 [Nitrospirae bacterium GWD2_57_9]|nr:MAG: hypothetical protein A2010_14290 [Nitrospirae bacterium GWD2_57_9]
MSSLPLQQELAHLQEQIEQVRRKQGMLKGELRAVEAGLERLSADRQRFDALRDFCRALDKLGELKADDLFWEGARTAGQVERAKGRVAGFEREVSGVLEKQAALKEQLDRCLDELYVLDDEVRDAYAREERREEEYVIEREISPVPERAAVMPWSRESESERLFRKTLLAALALSLSLGALITLLHVPVPVRPAVVAVPERLVSMLRKEPPKPEPPKEEEKPDQEKAPKEDRPEPTTEEEKAARKKAESTGVLAFKESFKDLVDEAPASRLGAAARLTSQPAAAGQPRASRSLVAMPSTGAGSSGGIGNAGVSRTVGHDSGSRIGGVGFTRVESTVAGLAEEAKPVSAGTGPVRTDEEIQIVFDKYKATLYRMYNTELRKNPTLRGRIILRITIEPDGEVSACTVQTNDLGSPELVAQIVARVKKFNFGPKEKVSKTTILYPIDFLPGG